MYNASLRLISFSVNVYGTFIKDAHGGAEMYKFPSLYQVVLYIPCTVGETESPHATPRRSRSESLLDLI